jgi:hypothetical protein
MNLVQKLDRGQTLELNYQSTTADTGQKKTAP